MKDKLNTLFGLIGAAVFLLIIADTCGTSVAMTLFFWVIGIIFIPIILVYIYVKYIKEWLKEQNQEK